MDSIHDVADIVDPESDLFLNTDVGNSLSSNKPNERNAGSLKRKTVDASEENMPKKIPRIDDSDLLTKLDVTDNDLDITWYSFADGGDVTSKENSFIGSANKILCDLLQIVSENANEEVNYNIINDNSITSKDAEDINGFAILARTEQKEHLSNNGTFEDINTDDGQIQNNFQTPSTSNINMKNKIADENGTFREIIMADDTNTSPKFSSFTISEEDGFMTSINQMSISNNDVEKKCSLVSTELNMDCTLENEECYVNPDHQVLNNTQEISDICSGFALLQASSKTTQSINDESTTKRHESEMQLPEIKLQNTLEQIIEANKEGSVTLKNKEQPNDKHFDAVYNMDHTDTNVEPLADRNKVSNKNKVTKNEGQISNSSGCETKLITSDDFSSAKIPSNTDALALQELQNNFIPEEKSTEATKLQNAPDQIMEANEEVSVHSKNKEESKDKRSSGTKKRTAILKERALEEESGIILGLIMEYIENTMLEEFTSSDIIDFVTERMPNVIYFKVLHAVRIFIVNNLKSAVLKKSGLKYRLGGRASDASVANIS